MKIQIVLINEFGEFYGEVLDINDEQYQELVQLSKTYYESGFEMTTDEDQFIIFPPEIVKKSILRIDKK